MRKAYHFTVISGLMGALLFSFSRPVPAQYVNLYPGFPSVQESRAYQLFLRRPPSERSKLLYLIDRFGEAKIQVLYGGYYFDALWASRFAKWFLFQNYGGQTAREWIMLWCNTSLGSGELIRVKLPDGTFRLSREVLLGELDVLESLAMEEKKEGNE